MASTSNEMPGRVRVSCYLLTVASLLLACSSSSLVTARQDGDDAGAKVGRHSLSRSYFDELRQIRHRFQNVNSDDLKRSEAELSKLVSTNPFVRHVSQLLSNRGPDVAYASSSSFSLHDEEAYGDFTSGGTKSADDGYAASLVHRVLQDLRANGTVSSTCVNDTGRMIVGLVSRDSWALQFLDATGKPGPSITKGWLSFVGNYDQCKAASAPPTKNKNATGGHGFSGNYCNVPFSFAVNFLIKGEIGVCFPSTCSSGEISEFLKELGSRVKLPVIFQPAECLTGETEVTSATVVASIFLAIIGLLVFVGTGYDYLYLDLWTSYRTAEEVKDIRNGYEALPKDETSKLLNNGANVQAEKKKTSSASTRQSVGIKVLLSFSAYSNAKKVLNTSQGSGALGSIHGIRFLSMSWVVLGHVFLFVSQASINDLTQTQTFVQRWTFDAIANALVSVDTFFALSGLLLSYLTIKELKRTSLKINWGMFYFHRFWRLTPPYMLAILMALAFQQYLGHGSTWSNVQPADREFCEKNWWTNLLYVNNIVHPNEMCFTHSWYLANDMQFFVLSPLMLIPFYFHWVAGVGSCTVFLLASWITTGVMSTDHAWHTGLLSIGPDVMSWVDDYYFAPWCRIGPYIVGILAGYILSRTDGKPFRMRGWVVVLGWTVAATSALAVLYGVHGDISGHPLSTDVAALYNTVSRSVWAGCVCWVVIACSAGYGGPVNTLLSWSPFVALGRLTYMTYLIHLPLLYTFKGNIGMPFYLNDLTMIVLFVGLLVLSNMAAFVFMLFFESPMIGLEKALLRK